MSAAHFYNRVTLTIDLLPPGQRMHNECLALSSLCLLSLVLIARAVLLLERGHSDTQTHKV